MLENMQNMQNAKCKICKLQNMQAAKYANCKICKRQKMQIQTTKPNIPDPTDSNLPNKPNHSYCFDCGSQRYQPTAYLACCHLVESTLENGKSLTAA